jgi:hypothetical protein
MMRNVLAIGFCLSFFLLAQDKAGEEQVQTTKTERMDFPSGGLLKLNGDFRELTIEGWDQPGLEITTTKTTVDEYDAAGRQKAKAELDQVRLEAKRQGNEVALQPVFPRHVEFHLDTRVYVPRNARLEVHGSGQLYIDHVTGPTQAYVSHGTIVLHLPEQGQYDIDARVKWGTVNSDFPGKERRLRWLIGHSFVATPAANAQKLHLRAGYGDIVILKIREPQEPAPLRPKT